MWLFTLSWKCFSLLTVHAEADTSATSHTYTILPPDLATSNMAKLELSLARKSTGFGINTFVVRHPAQPSTPAPTLDLSVLPLTIYVGPNFNIG